MVPVGTILRQILFGFSSAASGPDPVPTISPLDGKGERANDPVALTTMLAAIRAFRDMVTPIPYR
jgi:hypothetical protein